MKILFIGDSLFRGNTGINLVAQTVQEHPGWQVVNAGVNGETLNKISSRLKAKIEAGDVYDIIVLEGGANDILHPEFGRRNFWFRQAAAHLRSQGHDPLSPPEFENHLRELLQYLQVRTPAKVVLVTMGCLGENLGSALNTQRNVFNDIIRKLAREFSCALADPALKVDALLNRKQTRDYLLENFFNTAFLDLMRCRFGQADQLSKKRGLFLTIDGCHLNNQGAAIFKREIEKQLFGKKMPELTEN